MWDLLVTVQPEFRPFFPSSAAYCILWVATAPFVTRVVREQLGTAALRPLRVLRTLRILRLTSVLYLSRSGTHPPSGHLPAAKHPSSRHITSHHVTWRLDVSSGGGRYHADHGEFGGVPGQSVGGLCDHLRHRRTPDVPRFALLHGRHLHFGKPLIATLIRNNPPLYLSISPRTRSSVSLPFPDRPTDRFHIIAVSSSSLYFILDRVGL